MFVQFNIIGGLMVGIEFLWEINAVVIDLGIFRIYIGKVPKKEDKND